MLIFTIISYIICITILISTAIKLVYELGLFLNSYDEEETLNFTTITISVIISTFVVIVMYNSGMMV